MHDPQPLTPRTSVQYWTHGKPSTDRRRTQHPRPRVRPDDPRRRVPFRSLSASFLRKTITFVRRDRSTASPPPSTNWAKWDRMSHISRETPTRGGPGWMESGRRVEGAGQPEPRGEGTVSQNRSSYSRAELSQGTRPGRTPSPRQGALCYTRATTNERRPLAQTREEIRLTSLASCAG